MRYARIAAIVSLLGFIAAIPFAIVWGGYLGLCSLIVGLMYAGLAVAISRETRQWQREKRVRVRAQVNILYSLPRMDSNVVVFPRRLSDEWSKLPAQRNKWDGYGDYEEWLK